VVLDTPAGLHGWRLKDVLKLADKVIVPLQPSVFDIFATRAFLDKLTANTASRWQCKWALWACASTRAPARPSKLHHFRGQPGPAGAGLFARHAKLCAPGRARAHAV
jgi:chromosome partitioning protein